MARVPRSFTVVANMSVHKVWRGHNREWNLGTDEQKETYVKYLNEDLESEKYEKGATFNAITVMSSHPHEIFSITHPKHFSNYMRRHHSRYGSYFNRTNSRCGKVAQDRPHTTLLENARSEMEATFYVHANPIRANIKNGRNYKWSTHKLYAFGKKDDWMRNVTLPKWYLLLGHDPKARQKKYRRLFDQYLRRTGIIIDDFLKMLFLGTPLWIAENEARVTEWKRDHGPPNPPSDSKQ